MDRCVTLGLAKGFRLDELRAQLTRSYRIVGYREVLLLQAPVDAGGWTPTMNNA